MILINIVIQKEEKRILLLRILFSAVSLVTASGKAKLVIVINSEYVGNISDINETPSSFKYLV